MDVTISIVTYNTKDLLKRCLTSIFKHAKNITLEVIVVDNNSKDKTVQMVKKDFPTVKFIANNQNKFFTKANNQAFAMAKGKYILILNSDTYFVDNSIKTMVTYLNSHKDVGAVEGLEIYENNTYVQTGSLFSTPLIDFYELSWFGRKVANKKILEKYRMDDKKRTATYEIDVGCDAFIMVRTDLLKKLKGYDENMLPYYTENDLCLRLKYLSYKIMHVGKAKVYHKVSASVDKMGWVKNEIYYKDLLQYYKKNGYFLSGYILYVLLQFELVGLKKFR